MNTKQIKGGVTAPLGFTASAIHCGIRKNKEKLDLALIKAEKPCAAAAVYTQNLVKGAPIAVTQRHIANGLAQAVICNSGIANTCNADGEEKAVQMAELAASALQIKAEDVIVASTGVIGMPLPIEPIASALPALASALSIEGGHAAAQAIMTTDTKPKELAIELEISGKPVRIGGIAKGSGMIHPNMATMLSFITTDAAIAPAILQEALNEAVAVSFNMISIDGDTSTNDMVSILASGRAGNAEIAERNADYDAFAQGLTLLCRQLSKEIAKDGEGATKLLICRTEGASDESAAKQIAKAVICSSLVKTAMFGSDANWGRVLCAIGYAGVPCDISRIDLSFSSSAGSIEVCKNGAGIPFDEDTAKAILSQEEIIIAISLNQGTGSAEAYGCDLTYEYVKINGDYRT
ncbi:MAG: bifunctional glutamate N-acetyltransferase/amino-acid acetyltransferase ArgJ [Oscillospiraceae bacterium]|nr:bifunctional glutamate N-acetyltransferase/amino-acid acetyltransferase ArgJ [Oscillospiraceae bacterium]